MKIPRMTMDEVMMSETQASIKTQYVDHTSAILLPPFRISITNPMSRISEHTIITTERHNVAAMEIFWPIGIMDLCRITIGTATTGKISIMISASIPRERSHTKYVAYDIQECDDDHDRKAAGVYMRVKATFDCPV